MNLLPILREKMLICTGGKVSFYTFRDDTLYRNNQTKQQARTTSDEMPRTATVAVQTLLSATVHDVKDDAVNYLEDNITIQFRPSEVNFMAVKFC